jgi:hypothetical protein
MKKTQSKSCAKITQDELRAYLENKLPAERYKEVREVIDRSFFYQKVLEGIKTEDAGSSDKARQTRIVENEEVPFLLFIKEKILKTLRPGPDVAMPYRAV